MISPKPKRHIHSFKVERIGFKEKDQNVTYLDLRCSCGMPLFCPEPTTHSEFSGDRSLKTTEL